jgi:hypothetical protein
MWSLGSILVTVLCLLWNANVGLAIGGYEFYQISAGVNSTTMNCLQKNGAQFIVPQGMGVYNQFATSVCQILQEAKDAGIEHRDVHFFPSPTSSKPAADQLQDLVDGMKTCSTGLWSNRLWLDVSNSQYWYTPWNDVGYRSNKKFYEGLVDGCEGLASSGVSCGVYSSSQQWGYIFNDKTYSYKPTLPLWFTLLDGVADLSGFSSFGGFTEPYAKTYQQEKLNFCGYDSYFKDAVVPQW